MLLERIEQFAKEQGYETAKRLQDWNGYECYEPILDESEIVEIGPPLLILVKDGTIRMSTVQEAFAQIEENN